MLADGTRRAVTALGSLLQKGTELGKSKWQFRPLCRPAKLTQVGFTSTGNEDNRAVRDQPRLPNTRSKTSSTDVRQRHVNVTTTSRAARFWGVLPHCTSRLHPRRSPCQGVLQIADAQRR